MKIISTAVLVALFSVSNARFLDAVNGRQLDTNVNNTRQVYETYPGGYNQNLNCGLCIGMGHTYCIRKAEQTMTTGYQTFDSGNGKCLQNTTTSDGAFTSNEWSCSNAFVDRVYSKYTCQINTGACGASNSTILTSTANTTTFSVTNLAQGQVCMYKVQSTCHAPAFTPTTTDYSKVEIEYVEYRDSQHNSSTVIPYNTASSSSTTKRQAAPQTGYPRRDQYFFGDIGGNMVPLGNITAYTNVATNGVIMGRSGRYDEIAGGRKVYGNPMQGASQLGNLTDLSLPDCANRTMLIAVTSLADNTNVALTVSNVAFYRPPTATTPAESGASFLSMTFAAVLGLVSLAFF